MKFEELKKSLATKIENNYILYGNDAFVLQYALGLIVDACKIQFPEMNYLKFAEDFSMETVLKALDTMPMMSDYKIVYLDILDEKKKCPELIDYLKNQNPTTVLVVNIHDHTTTFKSLLNSMNGVDCNKLSEKLISAFITRELSKSGKSITVSAVNKLMQYCLQDMSTCINEANKLSQIIGNKSIVEESDVDRNVTKNLEYQIFELTEALAKKDSNKVYELLGVIRQKKENAKSLNSLILNHFRRMFHVSLSNSNKSELANMLGVKEFAITKTLQQAKLFTKKQLKSIFDTCTDLDYKLKNSEITNDLAVDYVCLFILNLK